MNIKGVIPLSVGYLRSLCSSCDGNNDAKIRFANYERFDDNDQEMEDAMDWDTLDGGNGTKRDSYYVDEAQEDQDNKITEWQAGWNVTNAIQVISFVTV